MPAEWPTPSDLAWAMTYCRNENEHDLIDNIDQQAAKARDHHKAKGSKFADWSAAWRTWATKAVEFARKDHQRSQPHRIGAMSAIEGIRAWEESDD